MSGNGNGNGIRKFAGGATRSTDADDTAFELEPAIAKRRVAARWRKGELAHGGVTWQKGQPIREAFKHALTHLVEYQAALEIGVAVEASKSEDHLAAAICNLQMLMWAEEVSPEAFKDWMTGVMKAPPRAGQEIAGVRIEPRTSTAECQQSALEGA